MAVRIGQAEYGTWLREQRDAIPMTQEELAAALGISTRALQTYEGGASLPRPARRRAIAAYFAAEEAAA